MTRSQSQNVALGSIRWAERMMQRIDIVSNLEQPVGGYPEIALLNSLNRNHSVQAGRRHDHRVGSHLRFYL